MGLCLPKSLRTLFFGAYCLACLFPLRMVHAQAVPLPTPPTRPQTLPALTAVEAGPRWSELSPTQQQILQPIEHLWPSLEDYRKRKWLAIAKNFPNLSPESQAIAQERMRQWVALSPSQRAQARLNFAQSQELSTDEKKAKWEAFQSLNEDEKQKLSDKKPGLPKGAATAPKPIPPEKLTSTPKPKEGQEKAPRIETADVHPQTLLPVKKTDAAPDSRP